jgi:hypothetical protein
VVQANVDRSANSVINSFDTFAQVLDVQISISRLMTSGRCTPERGSGREPTCGYQSFTSTGLLSLRERGFHFIKSGRIPPHLPQSHAYSGIAIEVLAQADAAMRRALKLPAA